MAVSPARALGEEASTGGADHTQPMQEDGVSVEDPFGQIRVVEDSLATDYAVTGAASTESQEPGTSDASCGPIVVQSSPDASAGESATSRLVSAEGEDSVGLAAQATSVTPHVSYRTHVQRVGWQGWRKDGKTSGTSGRSLRLEAINIKLTSKPVSGSIKYRTHVQTYGWQSWRTDGAISGTSGEAKRLEAIQIKLAGKMAKRYDVWYRVHAQGFGWMGWAKNGASAGTAGYAYRLEAIQIKLVKKGGAAPGPTKSAFKQRKSSAYILKGDGWSFSIPKYWQGKVDVRTNTYSNRKDWHIISKRVMNSSKQKYEVLTVSEWAQQNKDYESSFIERVKASSGQLIEMRGYSLAVFLRSTIKGGKRLELYTDVYGPEQSYDTGFISGKAALQSFGDVDTYDEYMNLYRLQSGFEVQLAESCLRMVAKSLTIL
jgi:uncharacterized protein YjdB